MDTKRTLVTGADRHSSHKYIRGRSRRIYVVILWTVVFTYYYSVGGSKVNQTENVDENANLHFSEDGGSFLNARINIGPSSENVSVIGKGSKCPQLDVHVANCTPPGFADFPKDVFSQHQRQHGFVIIHFLVSAYIFLGLAIVCDDFFVPSIQRICEDLNIPSDVAGATLMAVATSSPELFTNIIGTFITKGDVGVGAIMGSGFFNILAVPALCGISAGMGVLLEWWSVTRDSFFYSVAVVVLLIILRDERVYWYEAIVLVLIYLIYILVMYKNATLKKRAEKLLFKVKRRVHRGGSKGSPSNQQNGVDVINGNVIGQNSPSDGNDIEGNINEAYVETAGDPPRKMTEVEAEMDQQKEEGQEGVFDLPHGEGWKAWTGWTICFLWRLAFSITIPDCRQPRWKKWYPLAFLMCIVWIGTLSYFVNWMIAIIGHTCRIPDSVMGLTFIAAGASVPEMASSIIVARQGLGNMAVSNSIGSNTFDVLICLGIPWLIRASMLAGEEKNYVQINSAGFEYSTMMLIASVVVLFALLAVNKFILGRRVGILSLVLYCMFIALACLLELNVFFIVNLPTCEYLED